MELGLNDKNGPKDWVNPGSQSIVISSELSAAEDRLFPDSRIVVYGSSEYSRLIRNLATESNEKTLVYSLRNLAEVHLESIATAIQQMHTEGKWQGPCFLALPIKAGSSDQKQQALAALFRKLDRNVETRGDEFAHGELHILGLQVGVSPDKERVFSLSSLLRRLANDQREFLELKSKIKDLNEELEFSRARKENSESVLLLEKVNSILRTAVSRERELRGQISQYRRAALSAAPSSRWMKFASYVNVVLGMSPREFIAHIPRMIRVVLSVFMERWERLFSARQRRRERSIGMDADSAVNARELNEKAYLFVPINGAGLGHLTRCLAVATALKKKKPDAEIVFLTTSTALSLIPHGTFTAYNIPSFSAVEGRMQLSEWNSYFYAQMAAVVKLHGCKNIVFDGTLPYSGIVDFLTKNRHLRASWIRRGLYKNESMAKRVSDAEALFSSVIVPGELETMDAPKHEGITHRIAPILMLPDPSVALDRESACRTLGLDSRKKNIYVQLGAGNINEIQHLQALIYSALTEIENSEIIVAESIIKEANSAFEGRFRTLKDYPNTRFYEAFDLCVSAAGYNSVYESVALGLKTIFIPNEETGSDDQVARARMTESVGVGAVYLGSFEKDKFLNLARKLLSEDRPHRRYELFGGAGEAAEILLRHE